jgi:hypothetical protein
MATLTVSIENLDAEVGLWIDTVYRLSDGRGDGCTRFIYNYQDSESLANRWLLSDDYIDYLLDSLGLCHNMLLQSCCRHRIDAAELTT